jgi:hypothetical protein
VYILANPKDRYGNPVKGRWGKDWRGGDLSDGKSINRLRRWFIEYGWDPGYGWKPKALNMDVPPDYYLKMWNVEMSRLKRERVRRARYFKQLEGELISEEWTEALTNPELLLGCAS